jgi:ferritin-like metal-binding protein YciE
VELFIHRLQQMLWVEEQLADEILPLLYDHVHAIDLKYGIERHLLETKQHALTVRVCLNAVGAKQDPVEDPVVVASAHEPAQSDLAIAALLARNEHLEIASYTWLRSVANALGEDDVGIRLTEVLEQEEYALELVHKATAKILAETVTAA